MSHKRGARPFTVTAAQVAAGTSIVSGPCRLVGWSLISGGAAAAGQIGDSAQPLAMIELAATSVDTHHVGDEGLEVLTDIIVSASSGQLSGVIWAKGVGERGSWADEEWQENLTISLLPSRPERQSQRP